MESDTKYAADKFNKSHKARRLPHPINAAIAHAKTIIWSRIDAKGNEKFVDSEGNDVSDGRLLGSVCKNLFVSSQDSFSSVQSGVGGADARFLQA